MGIHDKTLVSSNIFQAELIDIDSADIRSALTVVIGVAIEVPLYLWCRCSSIGTG